MKYIPIIVFFSALSILAADSDPVVKNMFGKMSLTKDILLNCDSVKGENVTWISQSTMVLLNEKTYECAFVRTSQKQDVEKCSQVAKTELAKNESREYKITSLRKESVVLDFSTNTNALLMLCKVVSGNMTEVSIADFKKISIAAGIELQKIEKPTELKAERIRYRPTEKPRSDLISI